MNERLPGKALMRLFLRHNLSRRTSYANYLAVALFVLFALSLFSSSISELSGSPSSHFTGEALAATLAAVAGAALWFAAKSTDQKWLRVLAAGFLIAAALDIAHGVAAETWGHDGQASNVILFMSRAALAVSSVIAFSSFQKNGAQTPGERISAAAPAMLAVGLLVIAGMATAFSSAGFPGLSAVTLLFSLSGAGFAVALFMLRSRQPDFTYFQLFLVASLFVNVAADGAFMAYSTSPFDSGFAVLHLLRLASYVLVTCGAVAESIRLHGQERLARVKLASVNDSLSVTNQELADLALDLQVLNQIGRIAGESRLVSDRFDEIGDAIASRISADRILVAVIGARPGVAVIEAVYGQTMPDRGPGDEVPLRGTVTGDIVKEKKTLTFSEPEIQEMAKEYPRNTADLQAGFKSWMSTQILVDDKVVGSLMARSKQPGVYGRREIQFFEQVASQLAGPILQSQLANSKNLFYSSISHELKTPIAASRGYVGLLKMTGQDNLTPEQLNFIDSIDRNNVQLLMLIDDLMDVGTISDHRLKVNLQSIDLDSVLRECIEDLEILANAKGQKVNAEIEAQNVIVKADRRRLAQMITNIGSNASKYSSEGSPITIRVTANGDELEIAITDQGLGISPRDQQKLFTPFFRSSNSTALKEKGTGLGLVISKSIAESHGGSISIHSKPGEGSTFTISVPLESEGLAKIPGRAIA